MAQLLPAGIQTLAKAPLGPKWNFGEKKPFINMSAKSAVKHMYEPYTHLVILHNV